MEARVYEAKEGARGIIWSMRRRGRAGEAIPGV